ncbi:hypothetical protein SAMN04515658_11261 [Idiomarina zobellii]|jgi:hypothetical protein|nr:hypothetical protein SAMN04515658_11261 [Idiomarina zobellii]|tara:strand:+ start:503 stop:613 length:111 start_codon:yes stop_codon:yes gene_type:complete
MIIFEPWWVGWLAAPVIGTLIIGAAMGLSASMMRQG